MSHPPVIYCLILHPRIGRDSLSDIKPLQTQLQNLGLLGEGFQLGGQHRYRLGGQFYQWLTFMGCAPALKLEPDAQDDEKFCHFRLHQLAQPEFRSLRPAARGRCPVCRKPAIHADEIGTIYNPQQQWSCPHCQETFSLPQINWKHEAGLCQVLIELLDVHPHEVVPTESLLGKLTELTGLTWDYFYSVS